MVKKYNILLRVIHWLMALIIIGLISVGFYMHNMPNTELKWQLYGLHKSFGVTIIFLFVLRVIIRLSTKTPSLPKTLSNFNIAIAKIAQNSLYFLMILIPVSGYIMSNSLGHKVYLFGYELIYLFKENKALGELAKEAHFYLAITAIIVIVLHIAGAIKHRFFDVKENDVLNRML